MSSDINKIEKYKEAIIYGIFVLVILGFFVQKLIPIVQNYYGLTQQVKQKQEELVNLKAQLKATKEKLKQSEAETKVVQKKMYSPIVSDMDNDLIFQDFNNDIIEMLGMNGVKANSINYRSNPEDDNFISKAEKNTYKVEELTMELISDYVNFEGFLKSLFKYPYFLKFKSIDIVPYQHNPKIIVINFVMNLYSKAAPDGR